MPADAQAGFLELLFQVEAPQWPVATFTVDHPGTRIVMNHVRFEEDHCPVRNVFTALVNTPEEGREFLEIVQNLYADVTILRQEQGAVSVLVEPAEDKMKFFKAPFTAALRILGQDRIIRPILILILIGTPSPREPRSR